MSVRTPHDDHRSVVGAQHASVPKAAASGDFLHYEFRRKSELLREEVICRACYESAVDMQRLSDREYAAGYRQRAEKIPETYPATCATCGASRDVSACALCDEPRNPYDPTLCTKHLNAVTMALSRALWAFRDQMEKAA